ncbi:solute carrier family 3 member 2b [Pygocentrus nattereri]|uniref:Glycosyl hydrolase family 13 catalytic domain-containing protein n=1 Tax=Pygocentrus nattereri TaxID=42514 RepID=A0A3B4DS28_PYGNA|nr:solute carrier family 3 member 2b [Pygocentrus nattereri]
MTTDTELDMKDVELNEMDPEKQPMTSEDTGNGDAGSPVTEKNGSVKVKIPEEKESKFTGLSKEELLKVAGTPGWVRIRWALLILFWLGWIGMLAGAVVIIVQAPRCKPLPDMNWWNYGALYQIGDVNSFTEGSGLEGLQTKIDDVGKLKVKGLIIGPIHASSADKPEDLNLMEVSSDIGNLDQLKRVIQTAHKKSISVVLDLTPNYKGKDPWFSNSSVEQVTDKVKSATDYWLEEGVDGILLHGVDQINMDSFWTNMSDTIKNHTKDEKKRVLIGVTTLKSAEEVKKELNRTGVDLLLSRVLNHKAGVEIAQVVDGLYFDQNKLAWNIGDRVWGHLASIVTLLQVKLSQLLLFTLPGTPVFNYGDEIGLEDDLSSVNPTMVWLNGTEKEKDPSRSLLSFFKEVSELRGKERSLQHGEYLLLSNSTSAMAYLRQWDQSDRYIVALNWHTNNSVTLQLTQKELPEKATVVISTDAKLAAHTSVKLADLTVEPLSAIMLKFPYTP